MSNFSPEDYEALQNASKAFSNSTAGDAAALPFTAPLLRWMNGQTAYKPTGGAPYWGGWFVDQSQFEAAIDEYGTQMPSTFKLYDNMSNKEGKEYAGYGALSVPVAIFARRFKWSVDPNRPGDKGRGHVQYLGYMAQVMLGGPEGKTRMYVPVMPIILSAKSYSAKFLQDAIRKVESQTRSVRNKEFSGLSHSMFYFSLGVFPPRPEKGKEPPKPDQIMVGPKGAQSPVTVCQAWLPEGEIGADTMASWFVGKEIAEVMLDYLTQAKPWLDAWNNLPKGKQPAGEEIAEEDGAGDGNPYPDQDGIPF